MLLSRKSGGYKLPEQRYKRIPRGFDGDEENIYLSLYDAMFAYKSYSLDETFFSARIINKAFKIYDDMRHLQKWLYEMTLKCPKDQTQ